MESKPGRVWEPSGKRVGPQGLCFEYTALRILRDGRVAYCAVPWGCGANPPDVRIVLSQPMDSELGGAQVRLESGTLFWGVGVGTSAIRKQEWKANPDGEGNRLESELVRKGWGSTPLSSAK